MWKLLLIIILTVLYYMYVQKKNISPTITTSSKSKMVEQSVKIPLQQQAEIMKTPEPILEGFGDTKYTSDVRGINNKNYQNYVFGGKIEK